MVVPTDKALTRQVRSLPPFVLGRTMYTRREPVGVPQAFAALSGVAVLRVRAIR